MSVVNRAGIIVTMAGAEAEKELIGFCRGGDGPDQYQIACMADNIWDTSSEECARWYARLRRQTARLVRKHRDKIECVAKALVEKNTLSAEEIDALVDQA
jgi:ATP-dependent Zn protease